MNECAVDIVRVFDAPRERVFAAWTAWNHVRTAAALAAAALFSAALAN